MSLVQIQNGSAFESLVAEVIFTCPIDERDQAQFLVKIRWRYSWVRATFWPLRFIKKYVWFKSRMGQHLRVLLIKLKSYFFAHYERDQVQFLVKIRWRYSWVRATFWLLRFIKSMSGSNPEWGSI